MKLSRAEAFQVDLKPITERFDAIQVTSSPFDLSDGTTTPSNTPGVGIQWNMDTINQPRKD